MDSDALALRPDVTLAEVDERKAALYAMGSRSEATRRAYASDWGQWRSWCEAHGLAPMPADPRHVAAYVADLADTHKPATIGRKLAALSVAHKTAGLPSPIGLEPVPATMAGIRRAHGVAQTKKAPVRVVDLRGAMASFPDDLRGKRDRALILVGYAGGFRRSELVALDLGDVAFEKRGAVVAVRRSKTDQEGRGMKKALPLGKNAATCPVAALRAWIKAAGLVDGALFRKVERTGSLSSRRLCAKAVADVVKSRARILGFDPADLGAHSLRAGLVTDGYAAGVAEADIMRQTGHRSRAVLEGYYREADHFRGNVTDKVGL